MSMGGQHADSGNNDNNHLLSAYCVPGLLSGSLHTLLILQAFSECLLCARRFRIRKATMPACSLSLMTTPR